MLKNTVLRFLEESYIQNGTKEALTDGKHTFTYKELRECAVKIGNNINSKNSKKPIIVLSQRDARCIVMFWGVLYSGNFYVPINDALYKKNLYQVIQNICPIAILSCERNESLEMISKQLNITYNYYEQIIQERNEETVFSNKILEENPAYMVFTSGSTSMPKGVIKTHRSIISFIKSFTRKFEFKQNDILGNQAEFDYDVAAKDIFLSAYLGAKLSVIPKNSFLIPNKLMKFLENEKVNTLIWSVAAVRFVAESGCLKKYAEKLSLEKVFFSGEVITKEVLEKWTLYLPHIKYVSLYAPSEITGNCLYYEINNQSLPEHIPLGNTFDDIDVFVLNENKEIIKEDECGEIFVRGSFLSSGYYKDMEKTKEKYIQNPLHQNYIDIVYSTGDICKRIKDELYFLGRKDYQIKVNGHRIESFEVEQEFSSITGINKCCCILAKGLLIMFYIGEINQLEVIKRMKEALPRFKIPNKFLKIDEFPKNLRGKIDRNKLIQLYERKEKNER